jgi:hypothetical protein
MGNNKVVWDASKFRESPTIISFSQRQMHLKTALHSAVWCVAAQACSLGQGRVMLDELVG